MPNNQETAQRSTIEEKIVALEAHLINSLKQLGIEEKDLDESAALGIVAGLIAGGAKSEVIKTLLSASKYEALRSVAEKM